MKPKLQLQLQEFHEAFGHTINDKPTVISDADVRLRARLIIEEALECLQAMFSDPYEVLAIAKRMLLGFCSISGVNVDMVKLTDGLGDTDYVVEGTRLSFGIDGGPIADEIHRSNMAKRGGIRDEHGKLQKPAGWTPPDIAGELRKQGWGCGVNVDDNECKHCCAHCECGEGHV